jgi:hypothetical protein
MTRISGQPSRSPAHAATDMGLLGLQPYTMPRHSMALAPHITKILISLTATFSARFPWEVKPETQWLVEGIAA